jgi:hypothetical protein
MDLPTKVYWATEVRNWTLAAVAILAVVSFAAALVQTRWQRELSEQKEIEARERERASQEKTGALEVQAAQLRQENNKLTERLAWRALPTQQNVGTQPSEHPKNSMLVITLREMEASEFGEQIVAALTANGTNVLRFPIGSFSPPQYGVAYFELGWTPEAAEILQRAGITATRSSLPIPPIPVRVSGRYAGIPTILVGLRPPP